MSGLSKMGALSKLEVDIFDDIETVCHQSDFDKRQAYNFLKQKYGGDKDESVKLRIIELLNARYGLTAQDSQIYGMRKEDVPTSLKDNPFVLPSLRASVKNFVDAIGPDPVKIHSTLPEHYREAFDDERLKLLVEDAVADHLNNFGIGDTEYEDAESDISPAENGATIDHEVARLKRSGVELPPGFMERLYDSIARHNPTSSDSGVAR